MEQTPSQRLGIGVITADMVKAMRESTGMGMQSCIKELERERLIVMIGAFQDNGDRELLCEILLKLAEKH